ncbi:MAG TPA: hypothetical protein RMH99_04950 [Sandaracinaceae bacterium LLY-WYZ-13_1]|nr:hypothetical protein [Sandaracinaceae bacterium LLY-WYZ-13_1]
MNRILLCSLLALLAAACGTRTTPFVDPPARMDAGPEPDGGFSDAGTDAGTDAGPPDAGTLVVDCGRSEQFTSPRRELTLTAEARSPDGIVSQGWTLLSSPPGASPTLTPSMDGAEALLQQRTEGDYRLRFDAADGAGRSDFCEVTVRSVVGPPVAICPEEALRTTQGVPLTVEGDGYDDLMVVAYRWEIVGMPDGASPTLMGADGPIVQLTASVRGTYVLRLTVFDEDMAMGSCEIMVEVTGPPVVTCPEGPIRAPTRTPVEVTASATDDVGIASRRWELRAQPDGSGATLSPTDRDRTSLTPDRQGRYELRYTATDVEGLTASCTVEVIGTPTPPDVTCPATVTTTPLTSVGITATAEDDGTITRWRWTVTDRPAGSMGAAPSPRNAASTDFTPDVAGVYELTVTATDDDGMTGTCVTRVEAGNVDGLRIEMSWDTNRTDMDLHLMNREGTRWGSGDDDCYYANCNTRMSGVPVLDWYGPDDEDDPRLDIDDTDGFGPENINITTPEPGTYRVAVHNYRGTGPNAVTVRIYCGGSTTTPRRTFGPVDLRGRGTSTSNDFWRVADVTVDASGCTIADLSRAGGTPWIERYSTTRDMR